MYLQGNRSVGMRFDRIYKINRTYRIDRIYKLTRIISMTSLEKAQSNHKDTKTLSSSKRKLVRKAISVTTDLSDFTD